MRWRDRLAAKLLRQKTKNVQPSRVRQPQLRSLIIEHLEDRKLLATVDLASLGVGGTTIFGADAADFSGFSVSGAGDVNGDGYDDLLLGAYRANAALNAKIYAGESYLIYGGPTLPATIDLASLGTFGIKIYGAETRDYSGATVSAAGDVNGDGFDDLIIGAVGGDGLGNGKLYAGENYLVFGKASLPSAVDLASLGIAGVTIFGVDAYDNSGVSISRAGDVNGDGFDDVIIGADRADASLNSKSDAGDSYVIFGKAAWPTTMSLASLGAAGMTIYGADINDQSGISVNAAGDINGDGFDDIVIGAYTADAAGNAKIDAGECYLIYGATFLPTSLSLSTLGIAGTTIFGAESSDQSGVSVSSAGDVDGDGFDDLIIGARYADGLSNGKPSSGESYLIFGAAVMPAIIDLVLLGNDGVTFYGADASDFSGISVGRAGDVNGDGFDDLLIGTYKADSLANGRIDAGETYVIFGSTSLTATIDLSLLGSDGVTIFGVDIGDYSGFSVSGAGDSNGDGFDDLIVGSYRANASSNLKPDAGESYLVLGQNFTAAVTHLGTTSPESLTGTLGADVIVGGRGNDILIGNGEADVILGGQGDDVLAIADLQFQRLVGGNGFDTLRLDSAAIALDLSSIPNNRLLGIEQVDITGTGNNSLTVTYREVLGISDESNTLVVRLNLGDTVNIGSGWTQGSNQVIGTDTFNVYTQGVAKLFVQVVNPDTTPPTIANIIVSGSTWSPAFIDAVDGGGTGAGNGLGYLLTTGLTLPNTGINRIYLQFSEPVVGFNTTTFKLLGVNIVDYASISTVSYDSGNMRGVIQLSNSLVKDKLRLGVSDAVKDLAMNSLDGDSNALAGGVLDLRFNVLVGDANHDGSVNGGDLPTFAASFNKSVGNVAYNARADWNSDGSVNGGDLPLFSASFNQSLPVAEPAALNFPAPPPASLLESLFAPLIDAFYSRLDEDGADLLRSA